MKKHNHSHTTRNRIIAGIVVLAIIGGVCLLHLQTRVHPYSDETITGNTSANLLNGGLFTKSGDTIFFANPYDQNTLYSMDTELGNVKKLYDDCASYINAAGKYIFYTRRNDQKGTENNAFLSFSTTGLYRIQTNGHSIGQLYRNPTQTVNLLGNNLYYQHYDDQEGLQLFRVGIDGKKDTLLLDEGASPTAIVDNVIYYTGMDSDHNIHTLSIDGGNPQVLCEGNFTGLSYAGGYLYCMDMENDYTLCRLNTDGTELTHLTQERIATYNVSGDGSTVYYQIDNGTDNGLYALEPDSGTQIELLAGNFNYLHIIDNYLFFEDFDGSAAYVMDTATEKIEDFNPGTK